MPYVPILGPVHPDLADAALFDEVIDAALAGTVLPFDKDRRWTTRKYDVPLTDEIVHEPGRTIIPVLSPRSTLTIKLHYYGANPDLTGLRRITRRLCAAHNATKGFVIVFETRSPSSAGRSRRLLIKDFNAAGTTSLAGSNTSVTELRSDQLADFLALANQLGQHGFRHLGRRLTEGAVNGPIITGDGARLVGAIGPLNTLSDRYGRQMMLPQYFGVLPEHHRRGHGRALWRAAVQWGRAQGVAYQLLQTEVGQPSDRLFLSEGLRSLGFTTAVKA